MPNDFDRILDECIDRIHKGESAAACLADHPEYASRLEPLLAAMARTEQAYSFTPSAEAKRAARQHFYAALEKQSRPSLWQRMFSRRLVWATLAAALVILLAGYFGLRTALFTPETPVVTVDNPSPSGNFAFLVTDDINAIADFSQLDITLDKVGLFQSGGSGKWVEFVPEAKQFDLTLLPNGVTQQLWQGDIPEGQYRKARLYISSVQGVLKSDGSTVKIKLPGNKADFDIPQSFQINSANTTSFTYDLTVMSTGQGQGAGKYHMKPQTGSSGVHQKPRPVQDKNKGKKTANAPDTIASPAVNDNRGRAR